MTNLGVNIPPDLLAWLRDEANRRSLAAGRYIDPGVIVTEALEVKREQAGQEREAARWERPSTWRSRNGPAGGGRAPAE